MKGTALVAHAYTPPSWCSLPPPPHGRLSLAHLPTPLNPLTLHGEIGKPLTEHNISFWIKRDDMTGGIEWGGNKIRKLEFLLADAQQGDCTAVLTIGGAQSNHCRATAAAARRLGLEPHLILRTSSSDIGTVGNLLMVWVPKYCNAIGTWGYLQAVDEVIQQQPSASFDHIVFACGSGGTAAGIVLGFAMAYEKDALEHMPQLHAVGVCDDPDYFFAYMARIAVDMGFSIDHYNNDKYESVEDYLRQHVTLHQGKGRGYAASTPEELQFGVDFAHATGIVLDPVYSGKALYHFWTRVLQDNINSFANQSILFWHTGGALGLYNKCGELTESTSILAGSPCQKLDVYGKGNGLNING
ncbi:1-aminocyclopropane-1-carboxylate deaminase [Fistulifera solaris]|uniref:1-aminocyclopropane-1-carboxylate deaminase n=1 Tax=Fistulifera solaris TaxID=1519565 RepID=A0A1Z5KKZ6_FISSO|nr:1-aminocyclopropane-1-carboxylate deaminase [Fistulifera solaris]|eukprot:GAX26984.1 1-aminocyclopropane-1-carboxylate deaminase [Fistulifera solaris]